MSATEIITIVGCLLLGYWIVAVFLPSLRDNDMADNDGHTRSTPADADEGASTPAAADAERAWHEVLDVAEDSSPEQITAAYRRKIREYHPDYVARMGEDIRNLAAAKSRQINTAYDYAMRLRGANLHA